MVHRYAKNYPTVRQSYWRVVCEPAAPVPTPKLGGGLFLQQDNAPPHRSQVCLGFFEEEGVLTLPNVSVMSPDINIIKNVWKVAKERSQKTSIDTLDELWTTIEKEFYGLSEHYIKELFQSVPRRMKAALKKRRYPTKY